MTTEMISTRNFMAMVGIFLTALMLSISGLAWLFGMDKAIAVIQTQQIAVIEKVDEHEQIDRAYFEENRELHKDVIKDIRAIRDHLMSGGKSSRNLGSD